MGHVRDLPESATEIPAELKSQEWARLGVNVGNNFEPLYIVPAKKKKVVAELKAALKDAQELIIATDEDREGESIGWHLVQLLKPKMNVRRMVFHEITKEAIQDAIHNPRTIDDQLVRAQETRRILDRLVGYTVSPLLWKKIAPGLSAGRVQSVAVRMLVRREEERREFHSGTYWDLKAKLAAPSAPKQLFEAVLQSVGGVKVATGKDFDEKTGKIAKGKKVLLLDEGQARALRDRLLPADWRVTDLSERSQIRKPPPPFTTSTLQQEANRKLRLSSKQTMQIAQKLYEEGHITYMRTDSVHLSNEAISAARKAINTRYGAEYLSPSPRQFTTKSKGAQEAHEAIRPAGTQMRTADELNLSGSEAALYDMIWKRTIATQMADARVTSIIVMISVADAVFQATGYRIDFPGFFRAYVEGSDDPDAALEDREVRLPPLKNGDKLSSKELTPQSHETQPPARFTDASLVKTLENEGIGRPSTYATIMGTIQDRGYAVKANNQLVPTFKAFAVNHLLEKHFPDLVDTQFTARMEQTLDDIAEGKVEWLPYLKTFYLGKSGLDAQVKAKEQSIDPREIVALSLDDLAAKVRIGRYGPYLEQQENEQAEPVRVSLPPEMTPGELVPEAAQKLLHEKSQQVETGPNTLGNDPASGEPVFLRSGPYGPYVQLGEGKKPKRASLLKGMKPETMTLNTALALLALPRPLGLHPDSGKMIYAGTGRFGPFVRHDEEFRSLAETDNVLTVGLDRAIELLKQPKSGRRTRTPAEALRVIGAHPEDGEAIQVMNGRYGPYLRHARTIAAIPRGTSHESLDVKQAVAILKEKGKTAKTPASKNGNGKKPTAEKSMKTTTTATAKKSSKTKTPAKKPAKPNQK